MPNIATQSLYHPV